MSLSIIIVNYKSASLIIDCLASAFNYSTAEDFEWIIVDNDSNDNSRQLITEKYPFVKWIDMGYNAGFARANNKGINASKGETVLLLNPDILIKDDAIQICYSRMQSDNSCIAASPQLLNADGSPQITGNYFMTGGLNHLLPLPYLGLLLRTIALSGGAKKTNVLEATETVIVDWINGAFLMVKKTAIEKAGMLDEDFFLYAEEIEWCSRLGKHGELVVYGDITTMHLQGESVNISTGGLGKGYTDLYTKKGLQLMVSMFVRIRKQFGVGWFLFHLLIFIFEIPIFIALSIFFNSIHLKNPFAERKAIWAYIQNVCKVISLSVKIINNKPYLYKML